MNFEVNFVLPHWLYWSFLLIGPLVALYLINRSFRRGQTPTGVTAEEAAPVGTGETVRPPGNAFTRYVDAISGFTGRFVGYWALIAPFIYTYEVIARYLLNSPTNWATPALLRQRCFSPPVPAGPRRASWPAPPFCVALCRPQRHNSTKFPRAARAKRRP